MSAPCPAECLQSLNDSEIRPGAYVLYWMQQAQRAEDNLALETAIFHANRLGLPLVTVFGLMADYPAANWRHYTFLLEGLQETQRTFVQRGLKLLVRSGHPVAVALECAQPAALVICDGGYLRQQRLWRQELAQHAPCRVWQVETDVVVPVALTSAKAEYAARTIRPKIHKQLAHMLAAIPMIPPAHSSLELPLAGLDLEHLAPILERLALDRRIAPVSQFFHGGTTPAKARLQGFIAERLALYADHSNQPQTDEISGLSPYLHFGQIAPGYVARQVLASPFGGERAGEAFLEQLIVRRELAVNFVNYTADYDAWTCLPAWARRTLQAHASDPRPYCYTPAQLERAETHDPYWNAAMQEMHTTGFMHNYMRMYWGKQILAWSSSPEAAFATTLALNNAYFLDGRDPNSYAGVAWIYGKHDRPWPERPIFGTVRSMTAAGLERKCDIQAYVQKVARLRQSPRCFEIK